MNIVHHHHSGASVWMCVYYDTLCPMSQIVRVCNCDWPLAADFDPEDE